MVRIACQNGAQGVSREGCGIALIYYIKGPHKTQESFPAAARLAAYELPFCFRLLFFLKRAEPVTRKTGSLALCLD
jgi:hypothetical protein